MKPGILTFGAALLAFLILYGITHPRQLVFADPPSRPYSGPYTRIGESGQSGAQRVTLPVLARRGDIPQKALEPAASPPTPTVAVGHTTQPTPAPTRLPSAAMSGISSWYAYRPGEAAAGPALRRALGAGWRGSLVTVCASRCIRVRLTDWCACPSRVIDLDSRSFAQLAPLSKGLVRVEIGY